MNVGSLRQRDIACAIIMDTRGRFLLERRDDVVGMPHPGKIGLFGGHREGDETFLECGVREIYEEISYFIPAERFKFLASLNA
jgi:8-oxo-dGTP diphosphatase